MAGLSRSGARTCAPPDEERDGGGCAEDDEEDRGFLPDGEAGVEDPDGEIDTGPDEPEWDKPKGGNGQAAAAAALTMAEEKEQAEESEAAGDDLERVHVESRRRREPPRTELGGWVRRALLTPAGVRAVNAWYSRRWRKSSGR